ncbi:MAG: diguanylate cyclase [Sulfuricurvum sp.]|nr:diguanylate cyclase [Sulfuricurvum sp.]
MSAKASILIVDDEPTNLKLAALTLNALYEIHFARSGEDALDYLEENTVDLILLDIIMGEMNGFDVAVQLRKDERTSRIPIIFLTGDRSEETIEKAFESGAADYITKPFRQKELLARVKNRIETETLKHDLHVSWETNEHLLEIINSHVSYVKTDSKGIITEMSPSFCEMVQCKDSFVGMNINILKSGHTSRELYEELWNMIEQGKKFSCEIENHNFKEGTNWYRSTIIPDLDKEGEIQGYIAFYTNIDDKVQYKHDAFTDHLTGLNNRAKFEAVMNEEIYRLKRYKHAFSIILADIDYFKEVNDLYGHDVGDIVLKEFSKILVENIRQTDIVARWGGEEFVILCPNTNTEGAGALAETLRAKIEEYSFSDVGHKTASFGVTQCSREFDQKILFSKVDKALYQAKEQGRNRVCTL